MPELRVCALYPDLMNIYADRGNGERRVVAGSEPLAPLDDELEAAAHADARRAAGV